MKRTLSLQILVAVLLGCGAAVVFGARIVPAGEIGMLVVRLLKAMAGPLVFVAVLEAFVQYEIRAGKGARLVALSTANAVAAIVIGLLVATVTGAGASWRGRIGTLLAAVGSQTPGAHEHPGATLDPLANLAQYVPESIIEPFVHNNVITIVLLAIVFGAALRRIRARSPERVAALIDAIHTAYEALTQVLEWVIALVPFAVFGIVASVVARMGAGVFIILAPFLFTIVLGLALHVFVYYSVVLVVFARRSPLRFYRDGLDAIVTALSCGSSLATLPVTLRCLRERHGVSDDSARLAACVGTNLNHDGIILYEAAAALFVAHALGAQPSLGAQISIALAAVMAGVGIAGVPEAGLITLPLVLGAAKLPEPVVATMLPLLLPVDWLIGRCRAATNVTSDMIVAVVLDRGAPAVAPAPAVARPSV